MHIEYLDQNRIPGHAGLLRLSFLLLTKISGFFDSLMEKSIIKVSQIILLLLLFSTVGIAQNQDSFKPVSVEKTPVKKPAYDFYREINKYNVIWNEPSKDASGSMPVGNGDIGLNVWVEPNGDLLFLIGKTDAFDENSILQKLGRIRVHFEPQPAINENFRQTLNLSMGEIIINFSKDISACIWVDANNPVINIETKGKKAFKQTVTLETWRDSIHEFKETQVSDMFKNLEGPDPYKTYIYPDTIASGSNEIRWFHSNGKPEVDGYGENLRIQGLAPFAKQFIHPLFRRVSGALITGKGFITVSKKQIVSGKETNKQHIQIVCLTTHPNSGKQWSDSINNISKQYSATKLAECKILHNQWWQKFWNRSWVDISTSDKKEEADVYQLSQAYTLSRFMNACGGRGALPIKYNGSVFTYGKPDNPDFRQWGGVGYWFQNQRHTYYPMYAQGDFDLMQPFFKQFHDILPWQKIRTKLFFGHEGAFFPETITFWGTEVSGHYGWEPMEKRKNPLASSTYLTYYWQNGIETLLMMCEYWEFTRDTDFLMSILIPHAEEITKFYNVHYLLDNSRKILFAPASSLETYHIAINPLPEIAGLKYVLPLVANIPLISDSLRNRCNELLKYLPEIPVQEINGKKQLVPAQLWTMRMNVENPELYAVFPYRHYGDKKKDLDIAVNAYNNRVFKNDYCWNQDVIDAVLLGLEVEAKTLILNRASAKNHSDSRFPAFWNAFNDYIPDIDHGGVMQNAVTLMLLQCEASEIRVLPCFPKEWNVNFKLHAYNKTTVECEYKNGEINFLEILPQERSGDVTN